MKGKTALLLVAIITASMCVMYPTYASANTFGKTDIGKSQVSEWTWGSKLGSRFQCPENGIVTEIDWYGHVFSGYGSRTIYAAMYSDNNGVPDALLGYVSTTVSETWRWWSFNGLSVSVSANSYYWLVINWDQFNIEYHYDAGASRQYAYQGDQRDRPTPSDPFGGCSYRSRAMSIYAIYTPSGPDTRTPTYSNVGTNTTVAGNPCLFQAQWRDDFGLSGFIFGTNNSGTWQNDTWTAWTGTPASGWSNAIKTLNNTPGTRIEYRFWCNDTSNNWAETGIQYIVTTQKPTGPSTFGKTDVGETEWTDWGSFAKYACRFQAPQSGTITGISWYGYSGDATTGYLAVYSDNNGAPNALLGSAQISGGIGPSPAAWYSVFGLSISITANAYYWLAINFGDSNCRIYYDAGVSNQFAKDAIESDSPPPSDPFGTVSNYYAREMSIYATYTTGVPSVATIRGVVTDSGTGSPIQDVNVACDGMSTQTASDGSYSFTVNLGSYTLTFSKAGYVDQIKYQDCPTPGEYIVDVLLQPVPTATIRGIVTDFQTGNPIEGVAVTCDGESTLTALDGSYSFTVSLGSYTLTFEKPGYVTETRTQDCPTEGEYIVNASLEPVPTAIIRGVVTDSGTGNPIQGVNVACDGMSTLTASDGSYLFIVNLGSYTLIFSKVSYTTETRTQDCPTEGEYVVNVSMTLVTATIRGTVTDSQTEAPIAGVNVTVDETTSALTGSDGSYSFTVNLGSHTLTFERSGYVTETRTQDCPTEGEYIVNVSMTLLTATIRGVVTDSETAAPIAGVNVTCDGASTLTASDGSYSFTVNLGSYTLTFSKVEYVTETRNQDCLSEGEYIVNVALVPRTATITGTVTDSETGMPIDAVKVTANGYQAFTTSSGVYVLVVRLGSYTLTFGKPGYNTETTTVSCPIEGTYTADMSLRAGAKYLVDNNVGDALSLMHALGRKLFFANGRYWLFYGDGPSIVLRTSVDGESWSSKTTIRENAQGVHVYIWHEFREGTNYLHYVYSPEWFGMGAWYRRGVMNSDGTITWSADEQLAVEGIPSVVGGLWGVVPDSSGYPFIIYGWYTTTHPWETIHVYVTKSDYNNGTWSTSSGFPKAVYNATDDFRISAQIVPLTDQKMYIVYCPMRYYGDTNLPVQGRFWNGSALLDAEDISSGYQTTNLAFSIISLNDDVYLVYERELASRELIFQRRHNGLWEPEEFVGPLVYYESFFTCSIDTEGNFHVFWLEDKVRHTTRTPDASWSDIDYPFGENFDFLSDDYKDNIACIPYVNSGTIVVAWLERGGSPYALYSGVLEYSNTESNLNQPLGSFATPPIMGGIIANPVALLYLPRKHKKNEAESQE